jgi:uncharacterized membrane-anchored protein
MPTLQDHPLRYDLANELHARPFPSLQAPGTVVFIAIKRATGAAGRDRAEDRAHLLALLDRHGAAHPGPDATHHSARIGRHHLKWEQHAEFVTYTAFSDGLSARAFDPVDFEVFPKDWLGQAPGDCMTSVSLRIVKGAQPDQINADLADWFVPESLAVSWVMDKAAAVAGDFRIDPNGHMRFAVFADPATGSRRIGRIVQRLLEVETYKTMSMLGFARARGLSSSIGELDAQLSALTQQMAEDTQPAEDTLPSLLSISARLETMAAQSAFRFGATKAYRSIVSERIHALREARYQGRQTFAEFMLRRYEPAMRTVSSTQERLQTLGDRAIRAGDLLRTRVDVQRSAQNQALLESMDRRADLALRLQHTVEGLSVVAISYYAVSLASYALYPLGAALGLSKGMLSALVTVPVVALVWLSVRRIRKRLE